MNPLAYPTGPFTYKADDTGQHAKDIHSIQSFATAIEEVAAGLSEEELGWKYRPGGWTIRQVIHHCADSHMNAYMRFKLALTEDNPVIKPYEQDAWASLPDNNAPVVFSLGLLFGLHTRWSYLLQAMEARDFQRTVFHPEHKKNLDLHYLTGLYGWHCRHHLAHVKQALEAKGGYNG